MKELIYSRQALKALRYMPNNTAELIRRKLEQYAEHPTAMANNVKALKGYEGVFRLRVGDWRIVFTENGEIIAIVKIAPRGSAYA